jgi:serine/threonine-protein kinase HipA
MVGQLAQNQQGVYFQYNENYLNTYQSLSPFTLPFSNALAKAPNQPHQGLHGLFADSLPDGWGLLLMDRVFRQQNIQAQQITAMDRLAYVGNTGIGALSYRPTVDWKQKEEPWIDITALGKHATQLFDGDAELVLTALANAGSSGGARPKALIYTDPRTNKISTRSKKGLEPWLVKFTSQNLMLGHDEGLCEAAYLTMAKKAGIEVPEWQLIKPAQTSNKTNAQANKNPKAWLAMKRFDCTDSGGRYHTQSLCGLLDADFRQPSLDYEDCIKASQSLCNSPAVGQQQFTRAMFNLFADNQDDHTKNWSFLMDDKGQWQPAPFYDVTFSPNPHHKHMMAYAGYGAQPTLKAIQQLAAQANFSSWKKAQDEINKVLEALSEWESVAKELEVKPSIITMISKQLDEVYRGNKGLIDI